MQPTLDELTAYALGEGTPAQRAALEAYLATHPEAQAEVSAIHDTAALIGSSFSSEATPGLDPARRAALANLPPAPPRPLRFPHWVVWPGLVAAGVAVTMTLPEAAPPRQSPAEREATSFAASDQVAPSAGPAPSDLRADHATPLLAKAESLDAQAVEKKDAPALAPSATSLPLAALAEVQPAALNAVGRRDGDSIVERAAGTASVGREEASAVPAIALPAAPTLAVQAQKEKLAGRTRSFAPSQAAKPAPAPMRETIFVDHEIADSGRLTFAPEPQPAPGEGYQKLVANDWHRVSAASDDANRLSTFGADVDTAAYANVRRFLRSGQLPPVDAVRSEELINAFAYHYAPPATRDTPFAVHPQVAGCPWASEHRLVRIGLKGYELARSQRPPANLVFLVDVSGSMNEPTKLPLVQRALTLLTEQLRADDRVSIVTYAGNAGLELASTPGENAEKILAAIADLSAGGSTNGAGGINAAYEQAQRGFIRGGVNRVVLCTDGDFNVGLSSRAELETLIAERARSGVFLTALGFGMGNYQDTTLQTLANRGNGTYAYIDGEAEARKQLVDGCTGTLVTIAKDVKIQVEFNPARVAAWRLIGYEKRALAHQDFRDETKDAGDIGAGHTVTALYEIEPLSRGLAGVPALRYASEALPAAASSAVARGSDELLTISLRWKLPDGATSAEIAVPVADHVVSGDRDLLFAAAVAEFSQSLRDPHGPWDLARVLRIAQENAGDDPQRLEFIDLVRTAQQLRR